MAAPSLWTESGLEVTDVRADVGFLARPIRSHDTVRELEAMQKLAHAFVNEPETILQQLVDVAVELCDADSAGISIVKDDHTDSEFYHWVATAGQYNGFLGAVLPRYPSACGITLERSTPQHFRVGQRFFDVMGIEAPLVTDGILLPWQVDETRGTIFIMSHTSDAAFDASHARIMEILADFAAMGYRQQRLRQRLLDQASTAAAAGMANKLAHRINNPLQSLTNQLYLASAGYNGEEARAVGTQALEDLQKLSALVARLLALPYGEHD